MLTSSYIVISKLCVKCISLCTLTKIPSRLVLHFYCVSNETYYGLRESLRQNVLALTFFSVSVHIKAVDGDLNEIMEQGPCEKHLFDRHW